MVESASTSIARLTHDDGGGHAGRRKAADSVTEDSRRDAWLQQARSHLHHADPVLARLIDDQPDFDPRAWISQLPPMDLYGALLFQVTGQQLSVPATRRTLARIEALFDGHLPSPAELLGVDPEKLRQAGLSWRKINTLRDLAGRLTDGRLDPDVLSGLPDDELMAELTAITGIGPWTVQGALIIALGREDVVLPGDRWRLGWLEGGGEQVAGGQAAVGPPFLGDGENLLLRGQAVEVVGVANRFAQR